MDKKGRKRRFNDVALPQLPDLTINGEACKIYCHDQVAQSIQGGNHLIQWCHLRGTNHSQSFADGSRDDSNSGEQFWIERHDARILLDELTMLQTCDQLQKIDDGLNRSSNQTCGRFLENGRKYEEVEALDHQRYGLLPELASFDKFRSDCTVSTSTDSKDRLEDAEMRGIKLRTQENDEVLFQLTELEMEKLPENITTLVSETIFQNVSCIIQHCKSRSKIMHRSKDVTQNK